MRLGLMCLALVVACDGGDDKGRDGGRGTGSTDSDPPGTGTETVTDTVTDPTTPGTGPTVGGYAEPTRLEVTCATTTNLLRFTCTVSVEPAQPVELTWVRADGLGPTRARVDEAATIDHEVPVYFLGQNHDYDITAIATHWPGHTPATTVITTPPPPPGSGTWLTMTGTSTLGLVGTEHPCETDAIAVIYDTTTGDLVWYQDLDPQGELGMLDMVRFTDDHTILGETGGNVVEVDLLGNDLVRFPVSYPGCCGLNHDIFKHDGEYWSQYQDIQGGLTLDNIVVLDAAGVELSRWEPEDHLPIPNNASGDYLHTNTEFVDANGDFYLSWLNRDAVGQFVGDPAAPNWGERIWVMTGNGLPGDLGNDITLDWSSVPQPHNFGGQHNLHLTRDGRVMLLDNQNGRGLIISVDEATMTGHVDAAYDTHESSCGAQGTAMDAWNGNSIVGCNTEWLREYDGVTGAQVWEAEAHCANGGGGGWSPGGANRWYPLDGWE